MNLAVHQDSVREDHRVITIIEPQRLVVLGSRALFTMVGQLRIAQCASMVIWNGVG